MDYRIENKVAIQIIGQTRRMTTADDAHYRGIGAFWKEWNDSSLCRILPISMRWT